MKDLSRLRRELRDPIVGYEWVEAQRFLDAIDMAYEAAEDLEDRLRQHERLTDDDLALFVQKESEQLMDALAVRLGRKDFLRIMIKHYRYDLVVADLEAIEAEGQWPPFEFSEEHPF